MQITNLMLAPWQSYSRADSLEAEKEEGLSFGDLLRGAIKEVDRLQSDADAVSKAFVEGEITDLHQVVLAGEKAALALEMTVQVRNKVVEAYQELMRMQV